MNNSTRYNLFNKLLLQLRCNDLDSTIKASTCTTSKYYSYMFYADRNVRPCTILGYTLTTFPKSLMQIETTKRTSTELRAVKEGPCTQHYGLLCFSDSERKFLSVIVCHCTLCEESRLLSTLEAFYAGTLSTSFLNHTDLQSRLTIRFSVLNHLVLQLLPPGNDIKGGKLQ